MKNKKPPYLIVCILTFFILAGTSCLEGPTGPEGEPGQQGEQGLQGEQGPPGTANVIYSEWMDFDWNVTDEETFKSIYIEESRVVDEDFIANGTLLVFFKVQDSTGLVMASLPFTSGTDLLYFVIVDIPAENLEGIGVILSATDNTTPVQSDWSDYQLRYVIIPGGVPAKMGENFLKDYQAVKEYYQIPD